jgi:hypothetical protein
MHFGITEAQVAAGNFIVQVLRDRGFVRPKKLLGCVRFDVATVWQQPGE